jgi:hypothetical protein
MTEAVVTARTDARRWFYHWMALACLAVAVIGYIPTFFLPVARGTFVREPIIALHGMLFFAWIMFFCWQTWLAATGRTSRHREWGLVGVAIATAMAFSVGVVNVVRLNHGQPLTPTLVSPPVFVLAQAWGIAFFEGCVVAALMNVRRPDVHKRLMLLATVSLLGAPIARWWERAFADRFAAANAAAAAGDTSLDPVMFLLFNAPGVSASLLLVVAIVFDWRTRRRVSPVYAVGLPVFLLFPPLVFPLVGFSPAWVAVTTWFKGFGG